MKCYVILHVFHELISGKGIRKEDCMKKHGLSTSTFMRYVRNVRSFCKQANLGDVIFDKSAKEYKLIARESETK